MTSIQDERFIDGVLLTKMARGGAAELRNHAEKVNQLNVFPVPDGDTGDNMRMTIESGIAALESIESDDLAVVMKVLSRGMLIGARGNSGVILSQFFAGVAKGLETYSKADAHVIGNALHLGVEQAYRSVMTPTEGTILTVAREAVEYAVSRLHEDTTIRELFADLVGEMNRSLYRTPEILSVLKEAGVIDSGGAGLFYIMDGFNRVLHGEEVEDTSPLDVKPISAPTVNVDAFGPDSEMTYGYCTELLLRLQNSKVDTETFDESVISDFLQEVGNSVVTFRTETIVKIHVHTMTPEKVLEFCRRYGEFLTVKIENMSIQHSEVIAEATKESKPMKKYAIVAVCSGEGIKNVFTELGTDIVIEGGQTQNPSTGDFLDAFRAANAEHILVLPNNGNILMAARQAASLFEEKDIRVLESKSIGDGYAALTSFDPGADPDELVTLMEEAMSAVTTAQLTTAVRDVELDGVSVHEGDYIGFAEKKMLLSSTDKLNAAKELIDKLFDGTDRFMLTAIFGKDMAEDEKADIRNYLESDRSDIEAYFIDGEQDIYPCIFLAE